MIPEELKQHRQWIHWKTVYRDGKATKIPLQVGGSPASSTDPATWCSHSELSAGIREIGFVLTADDPYIGIDLDGCRDQLSGKLDDWAREIVLRFSTYTEVSPTGSGVKLFGVTDSYWTHQNKIELPGAGHGPKKPGIEVYDSGRYFAVTGASLKGHGEIVDVTEPLAWLVEKYKMARQYATVSGAGVPADAPIAERASKYLAKMEPSVSGQGGHNAAFKAACALVLGFDMTTDQAYNLLASEFNPRCQPPWSEKELRHKVESANVQPGQRGYIRDAKPDDWSKIVLRTPAEPKLAVAESVASGPRRTTLADAAAKYLESMETDAGSLITTGIPDLDHAIGGGVALGEMVIVAGRPSHGKSAIALQMIHHMTSKGIGAVIISEEMSAVAIGKRAVQFAVDVPEREWTTSKEDVRDQLDYHFGKRAPAIIVESCGSVANVVREVEQVVAETGAKVVAVDYVQLLSAKGNGRYEQVTEASQEMRRLASRLGIVVIVLAQLSRSIETRKEFVPQMSDLKETGQLEQDADVIIFGVWPHKIDPSKDPKNYQFFIGKNRSRETRQHAFEVVFEPSRQRLVDREVVDMPNYESAFEEYAK